MAKKKNNLTLEEKLQNALVPKEEQPYQIPDNWVWTRLTEAYTNVTSSQKKLKEKEYLINGEYPVIDQGKTEIGGYSNNKALLYNMDLPVIVFGDHTRSIKYIDFNFIQGADGVKVLKPRENWYPKCFYYALLSVPIQDLGYRRHFSIFKNYFIPLPPLLEQQRIVERIESLFSKLDEAKEKIQMSLDSFETRKSAILYQAFSGELTKKWREENGLRLDDWNNGTLQSVCSIKITDGTHQTPKYTSEENGIPFLSAKDIVTGKIKWDKIKYITEELHEELYKRVAPQKEDLLLAKNGTTGIAAIVEDDKIFDIYVTLALLRADYKKVFYRFLYYLINSPICKEQFNSKLTGIGVPNLHLRDIRNVEIAYPSLEEQKEIVRILDTIFEKEQDTQELIDLIEKIDLMKKSILARAFRGELGTNLPEEESAIELLKSILEEQ